MLSRLGAIAALLLFLVQPMAALAGGWEADRLRDSSAPQSGQTHSAPDPDLSGQHETGKAPAFSSPRADSHPYPPPFLAGPAGYLPVPGKKAPCDGPIPDLAPVLKRQPFPASACLKSGLAKDGPLSPIVHRGELNPNEIHPASAAPLLSYGPDTPPPEAGDWTVDQSGNNVNNTTILLNGSLRVKSGDLTLDNVSLIMNCTADGQYGINVSAGGMLNVTNCNITAFNGSSHYKFAVYGNMTMDRCNVSEMWGDMDIWREGGGVALFSDGTMIRSSALSKGETSGIQVHGSAGPVIMNSNVSDNGNDGFIVCDHAGPRVNGSIISGNRGNGVYVGDSAGPVFSDSTLSGNLKCGSGTWNTAAPVFINCTLDGSQNGIQTADNSNPLFQNCTCSGSSSAGIAVFEYSTPEFTNCTSEHNRLGIGTDGESTPVFTGCTFHHNEAGIETWGTSIPSFTNCTVFGSNFTGIATYEYSTPTFSNCTTSNDSIYGIQTTDNSAPEFRNCTSSDSRNSGIGTFTNSAPVFIDCVSTGANGIGIGTGQDSHPVFLNCIASFSNLDGISAMGGSRPIFTNCTSLSSSGYGIATWGTSCPVFTNCISSNSKQHGIGTSDRSKPRFTNCTSVDSNECGIITGIESTPAFLNCSSLYSNGHGVQTGDSSGPEFENCTFGGSNGFGIFTVQGSAPVFTRCTSLNNDKSGIAALNSSKPAFTDCTSSSNNCSGMVVDHYSIPAITGCTSRNNRQSGIGVFGSSAPVLKNCTVSDNIPGLCAYDKSSPRLERLGIHDNHGQNVLIASTIPLVLANSTVSGGSSWDIMLLNSSLLTILNTTYATKALVTGNAQLKVQWYAAFTLLDRARNTIAGATVEGCGKNGSLIAPKTSGPDGMVRDLIATEFIQSSKYSDQEFTYCSPYDFTITKQGETNITRQFPVARSLSGKLHFDYAPRIDILPDTVVIEDQPTIMNLTPHLVDLDNPLSLLSFTTDRDYVSVENATQILTVNCPYDIESDVVTVTVSDGLRDSTQTINLAIILLNDPPVCVVPIPDWSVYEDQPLELNLTDYFRDEESGKRLVFSCNSENITIDNVKKNALWTPGEGDGPLIGVVITANDGFLSGDSNPFNITCIPVNEPPVYLGGLEDGQVKEYRNWTANLDDHFSDEEDTAGLVYEASDPEILINRLTHVARWSPFGNSSYTIEVVFTAHDAQNYSLVAISGIVKLTYVPVNDPPVYLGKLQNVRLKLGEEWNITLEDQFRDDDTDLLRFSVNRLDVKLIEMGKNRHVAVWRPGEYSENITGLVFTAYDGQTYVRSAPIDLGFEKPASPDEEPLIVRMFQSIPWYFYPLIPAGILGGALAFYAYRKVKYGKYVVEQVFLINKDGRLLGHRSRKKLAGGGEDIISGMLTALQGFIKEFLRDEKRGELEEMKYGDLRIVIERGKRVYLAVFLSGYVTEELKTEMKGIIQRVDSEMGGVLDSWDGTVKMLDGLKAYLEELMGEEEGGRKR